MQEREEDTEVITHLGEMYDGDGEARKLARSQECLDKGLILSLFGDQDAALRFYRKALLLDPANALGHYMLGLALIKLGATNDALAEWRKAAHSEQAGSRSNWAKRKAMELLRDHGGH